MTSSARASTAGGIVRPRAFAALRLINQLELGGLLDGQITGLGALEDLIGEAGGTAIYVGVVHPVDEQPACKLP